MTNIAILVGNTEYAEQQTLRCCHDDLLAVKALLEAAGKYDAISIIENVDADSLKTQIRAAADGAQPIGELFYYFTGHGHQNEDDFYYCATDFNAKRPNESGLSETELHTLLRIANADTVVEIVDACYSGKLLYKGDLRIAQESKAGFRNFVRIASCLDSQTSITGDPLSFFTHKFRSAALRKTKGVVYYTDIINTLRDEFSDNNVQTPHFSFQATGRERFVDDASKLNELRLALEKAEGVELAAVIGASDGASPPTLVERLRAADAKVVTPQILKTFVDDLFHDVKERISEGEFSDLFDIELVEHANYQEPTAKKFIIQSLSNERRADNFVTATYQRVMKKRGLLAGLAFDALMGSDAYDEEWRLSLNCEMARAQVRITLTPRSINLQRIVLVVSCVPSLDRCYVFEVVTQHRLHDFAKFDAEGIEVSRRWWKLNWFKSKHGVADQIAKALSGAVQEHLVEAEKRLDEGDSG